MTELSLPSSISQTTTDLINKELSSIRYNLVAEIPPNCTDRQQPLDLAVNKPLKDQMKWQFHLRYAEEVQKKIEDSAGDKTVDLKLSRLKPLGLQWLVNTSSYLQRNDFIQNGFSEAGIISALTSYI